MSSTTSNRNLDAICSNFMPLLAVYRRNRQPLPTDLLKYILLVLLEADRLNLARKVFNEWEARSVARLRAGSRRANGCEGEEQPEGRATLPTTPTSSPKVDDELRWLILALFPGCLDKCEKYDLCGQNKTKETCSPAGSSSASSHHDDMNGDGKASAMKMRSVWRAMKAATVPGDDDEPPRHDGDEEQGVSEEELAEKRRNEDEDFAAALAALVDEDKE
ncbi:unnamed protein product [Amoebophrya sp. A120]|nr:unnamed protein product [Amoebophrya sp. A120]|eukprot:GSA120T00018172001.1